MKVKEKVKCQLVEFADNNYKVKWIMMKISESSENGGYNGGGTEKYEQIILPINLIVNMIRIFSQSIQSSHENTRREK